MRDFLKMIYIDVKSNKNPSVDASKGYQMNCVTDLLFVNYNVNYNNFISSNFLLDKLGVHSG
ncbi:hypothetical protein XAP3CFBP6996_009885 [Xanthomonas citri pv. fuscans CFBP 6996]|nr:hypothetical protein XAP3CFBP6996_009885 [Xanthomonas citri pv. fuscans CFBP 6996]QWN16125.1 hypothetical protein DGN02_09980 [Xanthomonas citri]SOO20732.1 hypothetical protein XFF6992_490035 [Xanthomonas citri pv. fuscans]